MTREEFKARVAAIAKARNWTLDIVENDGGIEAWFSAPHPKDAPGKPYGVDTAQAYMNDGEAPVGIDFRKEN